jgi:RNA polymerase sigma-70 factor, ECF subfamily
MGMLTASDVGACIRQAQAGDADALGRLLEQYRSYLRVLARVHISKGLTAKADASDIVQETLLDATRDFPAFVGSSEEDLLVWLRQILAANLIDLMRRYCTAQSRDVALERQLQTDLTSSSRNLAKTLISPTTSPSQRAGRRERAVAVAQALSALPEDYSQVLVLHYMEGLSFPSIAERMGRSENSVKKLWARAIVKMRGSLRSFDESI